MTTAGYFGIAVQAAFETPITADGSFKYFPVTGGGYGPLDDVRNLPPETGASPFPRGAYKGGIVFGGNIGLIPRLEDNVGWLFKAVSGWASTVSDVTIAQHIAGAGSTPGVNTHIFSADASNPFSIPYLTTRRLLPHDVAANQVGEVSQDAVVTNVAFNIPASGVLTSQVGLIGRAGKDEADATYAFDKDPGWATPTFDDEDTFVTVSCAGTIEIEGTEFDVGLATATIANSVLPPAQARKVGSPHPIDFPVLARGLMVRMTCFAADYDLYMDCFTGQHAADADWSCTPYTGDIDISLESAAKITGEIPYAMRLRTTQNNCSFVARPIDITPGRPVVFVVDALVQSVSSGLEYELMLQNAAASYA